MRIAVERDDFPAVLVRFAKVLAGTVNTSAWLKRFPGALRENCGHHPQLAFPSERQEPSWQSQCCVSGF